MVVDRNSHGRFLRRGGRAIAICVAVPVLMLAAVSCDRVGKSNKVTQPAAKAAFSYSQQIGWLHGPCLAIANANLAPGTPVALVITADPQKLGETRIQEKTTSPEVCKALMEGRAAMNAKPGMTFYQLEAGSVGSADMGFGIVNPPAKPSLVNGVAQVDLDQDGHGEVFSSCATTEGIRFAVWTDKAYQGDPRWSGYDYLDYEMTPTCR